MSARARRWAGGALLAACLAVTRAGADDATTDVATVRARELFSRGTALAKEARWADALAAFEQSRLLRAHASTSYDIGYCERALGHRTRARRAFGQALDEVARRPGELDPAQRADAETYRAEARSALGTAHVHVSAAGGSITVDGRPLEREGAMFVAGTREPGPGDPVPGGDFDVLVDPGNHVFSIADAGGVRASASEHFTAGSERAVSLALAPARPGASVSGERPAPREPVVVDGLKPWALGLGVAGAAGLVVSAAFALSARAAWSDAKAACPTQAACPDDRGAALSHDAHVRANVATTALVVSTSALAGATVLWLTSRDGNVASGVTLAPGSVSVAARTTF